MATLATEPPRLADGHPLHTGGLQRLFDVVDLEWLDDRSDELHRAILRHHPVRKRQRPQAICGKTTWGLPLTMGVVGCDVAQCSGRPPRATGSLYCTRAQWLLYRPAANFLVNDRTTIPG